MNIKRYFILERPLCRMLMAFIFVISCTLNLLAQNITSGLLMHYTFDDVTGTSIPDVSDNGQAATLQGATTLVPGFSGQAVHMSTKPDFVQLPANFTVGITSFTFAAWVRMDALRAATRFFDLGNGIDGSNNFLVFIPSATGDNTSMRIRYRTASPVAGFNVDAPTNVRVPINVWAHVAMTLQWNAATNTAVVVIYLNGNPVVSVDNFPYNPSMLGNATADNFLGRSRWTQDINGFSGAMDDVRFYNRALTAADVVALTGLSELNKQFNELTIGNQELTQDINLPTVLGTQGVTATWASSHPNVIDPATGKVTRQPRFDQWVSLTATLSLSINNQIHTVNKVFNVKVLGLIGTPDLIAHWDFSTPNIFVENGQLRVKDAEGGFVGTVMNQARIRTIGESERWNVLDLGNGTGFFDMGTEIGEAIYTLNDYTIGGFFRIDENYTELTSNGNFFWTFSNTADANTDRNGYILGRLNNVSKEVSSSFWQIGNQGLYTGTAAPRGTWKHVAYTQTGNIGRIFIDGIQVASGTITNIPFQMLPREGRTGTLYNWLGRSNYITDVFLRNTLLYGFKVYSVPLTQDNFVLDLEIQSTLSKLNAAFAENPDYKSPALQNEFNNLTLPDVSALTSNITLPTQGTTDPNVLISWSSSHPQIISHTGVVNRPYYFDFPVTLRANLSLGSQVMVKEFPARVLVKPGTEFKSDLLARFDFSQVEGRIVHDVAEKRFQGTTVNDARIRPIGSAATQRFNVLDLGNGTGYFDMGEEIGKTLYHLGDFTMSAFFRIDNAYDQINSFGNFIWTFSNTTDGLSNPTGYVIGSLRDLSQSITPGNFTAASGNQSVAFGQNAVRGSWQHFAYTQQGNTGTIYIDGMPLMMGTITNTPATVLRRDGQLGTLYNWIGRSNFIADVFLRNTLVYDFRLYKRALTDIEILITELEVNQTIEQLELAYAAAPDATSVQNPTDTPYKIWAVTGGIRIEGLRGNEKVEVFDIAGRHMQVTYRNERINLQKGIYIVRINNTATKIVVQ